MNAVREIGSAVGQALFGSTTRDFQEIRDADESLRRGVPTSRRLNLVSLHGGTGCSVIAAAVASAITARRPGRVLAVDGGAGGAVALHTRASSPHQLVARQTHTRRTTLPHRQIAVTTMWGATDTLDVNAAGLRVVAPELSGLRRCSPEEWSHAVDPVSRYFDVVVGDWGHRDPEVDLKAVVEDSHSLAFVTRADRSDIEEALEFASSIRARTGIFVAVVATDIGGVGRAAARVAESWNIAPVHYLPFDHQVRTPSRATRAARTKLAAALLVGSLIEVGYVANMRREAVSV